MTVDQILQQEIKDTEVYLNREQEEINHCIKKTIAAHNKIQGEAQKAQKAQKGD